jgi:hypothetical protein
LDKIMLELKRVYDLYHESCLNKKINIAHALFEDEDKLKRMIEEWEESKCKV